MCIVERSNLEMKFYNLTIMTKDKFIPRETSISSDTRWATDIAATLLGCVHATDFFPNRFAKSTHHCGI